MKISNWIGFLVALATCESVMEPEFESVTSASIIKLANKGSGYRLHSHEINYGSGSGQQSVTGFPKGDDANSLFVVSTDQPRGAPINCGQTIQLVHLKTGKRLHSHPLQRFVIIKLTNLVLFLGSKKYQLTINLIRVTTGP